MPSPFPGMDPYLEQFWRDIHARFIIYAADQLQTKLPGDLRARVEERVFVEAGEEARPVYPDVRIIERGRGRVAALDAPGVAMAEPIVLHLDPEPFTETYIEIIDVGTGKRIVTAIEVLSLSNKVPGEGQELYLRKQRELLDGRVSLVEIDLLRAGERVIAFPHRQIPTSHRTTYQVCVHRGWQPRTFEVYAVPLRHKLPGIRIPLRETDTDVTLDLQSLIDQCYRNGGYDEDIDYRIAPDLPLDAADAAWADELLRNRGRR
jgi:Protein of unknown function (DUF4058)